MSSSFSKQRVRGGRCGDLRDKTKSLNMATNNASLIVQICNCCDSNSNKSCSSSTEKNRNPLFTLELRLSLTSLRKTRLQTLVRTAFHRHYTPLHMGVSVEVRTDVIQTMKIMMIKDGQFHKKILGEEKKKQRTLRELKLN